MRTLETDALKSFREDIEYFTAKIKSSKISPTDAGVYKDMMKRTKETYVLEAHKTSDGIPRSIFQQERTDKKTGKVKKLWLARIDRTHQVTATTYDALIDKLYDYYAETGAIIIQKNTLQVLFPQALEWWGSHHSITAKTTMEYMRIYNKYYLTDPIVKKNIRAITRDDWYDLFEKNCVKYGFTRKQFMQTKIVATIIDAYSVRNNLIPYCKTRDIDYDGLPYAKTKAYVQINAKAFSESQKAMLKKWCHERIKAPRIKPIYYLAIVFNIEMGLRFSEMAALTWEKVNLGENTLTVDCQAPLNYERDENDPGSFKLSGRVTIDHMKSYEAPRVLFLTDETLSVLEGIRKYDLSVIENGDVPFERTKIFPDGHFRYHTYNEKIKEAAEAIGLEGSEYRTHSLRATAATLLYRKCKDIKTVQYFLGHTTPEMTSKYIKQIGMVETLRNALDYER